MSFSLPTAMSSHRAEALASLEIVNQSHLGLPGQVIQYVEEMIDAVNTL